MGRNQLVFRLFQFFLRVALHVRAWVEIPGGAGTAAAVSVALHVRAWVEIKLPPVAVVLTQTSPSM